MESINFDPREQAMSNCIEGPRRLSEAESLALKQLEELGFTRGEAYQHFHGARHYAERLTAAAKEFAYLGGLKVTVTVEVPKSLSNIGQTAFSQHFDGRGIPEKITEAVIPALLK